MGSAGLVVEVPLEALDVAALDEANWRRLVWKSMWEIEQQARLTNGRITSLEKFKWMSAGGLLVISAFVVPLFLNAVSP